MQRWSNLVSTFCYWYLKNPEHQHHSSPLVSSALVSLEGLIDCGVRIQGCAIFNHETYRGVGYWNAFMVDFQAIPSPCTLWWKNCFRFVGTGWTTYLKMSTGTFQTRAGQNLHTAASSARGVKAPACSSTTRRVLSRWLSWMLYKSILSARSAQHLQPIEWWSKKISAAINFQS